MSENYSRSLLRISVAQICQNLGWNSAQSSSLEVLTDVLERYLLQLGGICHRYSEQFGRSEPNLDDLALAFKHMCIDVTELEDYVRNVDPVPFAHDVVAFPAQKLSSLEFPNPQSREILLHREEHVDSHLPYMFSHLKDEVPKDSENTSALTSIPGLKEEPKTDELSVNGESVAEKRPGLNGTLEVPSKRQRLGNPGLPEEAGQSQYEMSCVFMNANGILTTRPGCQGKQPEARLPPPNPRNLSENNKENKLKGSSNSTKITISAGGIGTEPAVKGTKSGKKSSHKKGLHLHEGAAKAALDMTRKEIGKTSASSKAAAKFIKKLKTSKKSAKIFGKKGKEVKSQEELDGVRNHGAGIREQQKGKTGKRRKKEKKSASIIDSDEELRNLSSPSSPKVPSSEHHSRLGEEDRPKQKSSMDAVDASINAVLHDGNPGKGRKKKKKDGKATEVAKEPEVKPSPKKKGRPPGSKSKDKKPEPPPPIDIKPFVSDKYSSEELQVYEFNDSPPDSSSLKSRKSNAPTDSSPSRPSSKKVARVVEQEELFAPEFKIETIKPLKLDLHKEKEKSKTKEDKKEKQSEDHDRHKTKMVKEEKHKEKRKEEVKEKLKEKDMRKDKKEKKKDKEKKKKHKEKDRDKDKEKRRDEKVKESKESRESSPALGLGVKLKIKIGGSTGPSASMMVAGEEKSGSPSPSPSLPVSRDVKRESMSPPKVVPKLYISKKGQEEKTKKSVKQANKYKSSPLAVTIRSGSGSPSSNAASPSPGGAPLKSPVQTPSRKTPTPPPFAQYADPKLPSSKLPSSKSKEVRDRSISPTKDKAKKGKGVHVSRKDKDKKKVSKSSSLAGPKKSSQKPPTISPKRTRQSSSSIEHSSPVSPRRSKSRSQSRESRPASTTPPPPHSSRRKHNPPSPSPATSKGSVSSSSRKRHSPSPGGSPSKPPTPGSTSPNPMLDWSMQESPIHHSPDPNTPTGSPRHSPSHSSLPRTPNPHRSPSPADSPHVSPMSRTLTPELSKGKEVPSPASSGKSSSAGTKSRTVEAETVCVFIDDTGQKVWICPACKLPDDGSEMIGCDDCDNWYHWPCVGITAAPPEEQQWYCPPCTPKVKAATRGGSRGRGRPRGRGRGRGRKKIT